MAIFKCKMCGGTIEFNQGDTVGVCDSCGTKQTLPRLDDDKKANLYDRANHFRRNNDYDKAAGIYEQILNEDNTDAEAYWSLVLCCYGIEYVEDPASHKRVPTVNRVQFTSIFDDDNYKSALHYADSYQRAIYEEEANTINAIQKGILVISQKEEPFDVFICYKETDNSGRRTPDSVLANDLYHQLTQEGFKVFFSRITLEDKLGTAYEPYIFAALNSAKVMVVIGTKPEYFNAVWVKNEWSRYLALIKNGAKKMLIPAYKDMDPYELPDEFSHLQAQDMSKLGFMQDLIRGIKKIAAADVPKAAVKETVVVNSGNASTKPLLERAFMFLEDGNWTEADTYCEKVLDLEPKNAQAYLGKLMAELRVRKQEKLKDCAEPFDNNSNYQKALRFGDAAWQEILSGYVQHIVERNEHDRLEVAYAQAAKIMASASQTESQAENDTEKLQSAAAAFRNAADCFAEIREYRDAASHMESCLQKAENCQKEAQYFKAKAAMEKDSIVGYEEALNHLQEIIGWKDADTLATKCQKRMKELKLEAERKVEAEKIADEKAKQKAKKIAIIVTPIVAVVAAVFIILTTAIIPNGKYDDAMNLFQAGKYDEAYAVFESLDGYKDSADYMLQCKYNKAISFLEQKSYVKAYEGLIVLDGYKDSNDKAQSIFEEYKTEKLVNSVVGDEVLLGTYEQDNNINNGQEDIEWIVLAKEDKRALLVSKYALDSKPYNTEYGDTIWKSCSLRAWLNDEFLNNAFNKAERNKIAITKVKNSKNPEHDTPGGADTKDKVFLLSIAEADKYFADDDDRQTQPTAYAIAQGAYVDSDNGNCRWWLRSPGRYRDFAASVVYNGVVRSGVDILDSAFCVTSADSAVRPAMWINLES